MSHRVLAVAAVALALASCKKPGSWDPVRVDPSVIEVNSEQLLLRHDTVGDGEFSSKSSFVLVDAKNKHDKDLNVTLGGELLDAQGAVVGTLAPASLRVPKGRHRLFALLEHKQQHLPAATTARIVVTGAHELDFPPAVRVSELFVHPDGDRIMVSGTIVNTAERNVRSLVIGAFYDADGKPMTRPFTTLALDGKTSHPVHFKSTPGAVKGYLFIGQTVH